MPTSVHAAARRRQRCPRAFTLVELLVVVAIIALLVAIIVPSVGGVAERGRTLKCMTNQGVIIKALAMYHAANGWFPLNYAARLPALYETEYGDAAERWALGVLSSYAGGVTGVVSLRGADEGEFPAAYICPNADLNAIYSNWPDDKYHASYWTSIAIRQNRGFGHTLGQYNQGPDYRSNRLFYDAVAGIAGNDVDSRRSARITGKVCPDGPHWVSVYCPNTDAIAIPSKAVFSGDTRNASYYASYSMQTVPPGYFFPKPGWYADMTGATGFRHNSRMVMSYIDGHVETVTEEFLLANYSYWDRTDNQGNPVKELTGDFLLKYPPEQGCKGTRRHPMPTGPVE